MACNINFIKMFKPFKNVKCIQVLGNYKNRWQGGRTSMQLSLFHLHLVKTQMTTYRRCTARFSSYLGSSEVRNRVNSGERSYTQGGRQLAEEYRT